MMGYSDTHAPYYPKQYGALLRGENPGAGLTLNVLPIQIRSRLQTVSYSQAKTHQMERSIESLSKAYRVAYFTKYYPETLERDQYDEDWKFVGHTSPLTDNDMDMFFDDFKEEVCEIIGRVMPSTRDLRTDRWDGDKVEIIKESNLVEIGIAQSYAIDQPPGIASVSIRVHSQVQPQLTGLAEHWIKVMWPLLLREFDRSLLATRLNE